MAFYDSKPSKFEAVGNGSLRYRFNITETEAQPIASVENQESEESPRSQWECEEVIVWPPFTANAVLEAAIGKVIPATRENKLINDYNAAKLGLLGGSTTSAEAKAKIDAYKEFLSVRSALKEQVDTDCAEYGLK